MLLGVHEPTGVLLQMHPANAYAPACPAGYEIVLPRDLQAAVDGQRRVDLIPVLGDLVVLGKVRVVVVLPMKLARWLGRAAQGDRCAQSQVDRLPIEHRERPR